MSQSPRVPVVGSEPTHLDAAAQLAPCNVDDAVEVTVQLRPSPRGESLSARVRDLRARVAGEARHLSYDEFARAHGPAGTDVYDLRVEASAHNLTVGEVNAVGRLIKIRGRVADINDFFGVDLHQYQAGSVTYRSHEGPVQVPHSLHGLVTGALGLTTRPAAVSHAILAGPNPAAPGAGHTAVEIGTYYGVPKGTSAVGQKVGIIELGGGYTAKDVQAYCGQLGIPVPAMSDVSVDGGTNAPTNGGDPSTADGEVSLDIDVVSALAPGAAISMYFAPNTDQGFIDAIAQAVKDGCTAVSISWGAPESQWSQQSLTAMDQVLQSALAMGISVFCSAGDGGSTDGVADGKSHADFPASSPHAVGCGGTTVPDITDRTKETAWNDLAAGGGAGGGAPSDVWPVSPPQDTVTLPVSVNDGKTHRTVPDVAADAAPSSGYRVFINGNWYVFGGTSAVSPLMSAMYTDITAAMQATKPGAKLGDFNSFVYAAARKGGTTDIKDGSTNGQYNATPGYDAVTGTGTPNYQTLQQLAVQGLSGHAARSQPQRPGDAGLSGM